MAGPRATSTFLVLTALLFAGLMAVLAWQSRTAASWLLAAGLVVAVLAVILAVFFAKGVGDGRL